MQELCQVNSERPGGGGFRADKSSGSSLEARGSQLVARESYSV